VTDATAMLVAALAAEREAWLKVRAWPPGTDQHDPDLWAAWLHAAENLAVFPLPERLPAPRPRSVRSRATPTRQLSTATPNPLWSTRW